MKNSRQKFPNQTVERLTALRGILNMHERAIKAGEACKLNGDSRKFNMDWWDCGTAACALGSSAMNPWFKERGLTMRPLGNSNKLHPVFRGAVDFAAGANFFNISIDESAQLFGPLSYRNLVGHKFYNSGSGITPAMVRTRVDTLIEKYSKE